MIIHKDNNEYKSILKPIDTVINFFGDGIVKISPRGSIMIGKILIQRKGGDSGKDTSKMLQFKINPLLLTNLK